MRRIYPPLRLNHGYRKLLSQEGTERDVKEYVKERYRSALQLMRNIEQRKNTILRTCEAIVRRQGDFLERGVDALKPMMIKEVAEEIGFIHQPSAGRCPANMCTRRRAFLNFASFSLKVFMDQREAALR